MALEEWTTYSTNRRWSCSKKNPCWRQCRYYIFKNNLHFLHFWRIEMLKVGWPDCLKAHIHFLPDKMGSFQTLDKQPNHSSLSSLELCQEGLLYFNTHLSSTLNKFKTQIKQRFCFLPPNTWSILHTLVSQHIYLWVYFTPSNILLWLLTKENTKVIFISFCPSALKTKTGSWTNKDICTYEDNEAKYLKLGGPENEECSYVEKNSPRPSTSF